MTALRHLRLDRCTACNQRRLAMLRCVEVSRILAMGLESVDFFDKVLDEVVGLHGEALNGHLPEFGGS